MVSNIAVVSWISSICIGNDNWVFGMIDDVKKLVEQSTKQSDILPLDGNKIPFREGIIVKYVPPKVDTEQLTNSVIIKCADFIIDNYPDSKPQALHMLKHFDVK